MKWFKKIDLLLVFLMLSVLLLYAFVGDIDYFLNQNNNVEFKSFVPAKDVFKFPKQGLIKGPLHLKKYNSNFEIYASTDGGKTYEIINNSTDLLALKTNDLSNYQMSIRQKPKMDGFLIDDELIVKSFLVKAKHKFKNIYCKPKCITYILNYHSNLPIINIVTNQNGLVDTYEGIMVFGKESWIDSGFYKEFWYRNANFKQKGSCWRKKAYLQLFYNDSLVYQTITGAQISGHATRSFPQKSLKLKTDKRFNSNRLSYPFFGVKGLEKYNSVVLRISGNDNTKTLFADLLIHSLVENTNVITLKGQPINVFINGNYWGIYNLREKPDTYFLAQKENCKTKDITILDKNTGRLKKGSIKQQQKYIEFIDSVSNLKIIDESVIDRINQVINVESFMDYIIIETFCGNSDWLINNTMWYKAKHNKWKWILIDLDYGLAYTGVDNLRKNYFDKLKASNSITAKLFNTLIKNETFKKEFKKRAVKIINENFSKKNINEKYDNFIKMYEPNLNHHIGRWRHTFSKEQWRNNCKANYDFLINRPQYFLKQIQDL